MNNALIGYTGFVGSNLSHQVEFSELYNSKNISEIAGKRFDMIVCAGLPATKWLVNKNPEEDLVNMVSLVEHLKSVKCGKFVLISTVDVFGTPVEVDENSVPEPNCAYGRHRLAFEELIKTMFENVTIVRLPGLVGPGLKKNVIFDMIHRNNVDAIDPDAIHQYYDLDLLWFDVERNLDKELVHISTRPAKVSQIKKEFFPDLTLTTKPGPHAHYDVRTIHTESGYISSTIFDIHEFLYICA